MAISMFVNSWFLLNLKEINKLNQSKDLFLKESKVHSMEPVLKP